MRDACRLIRGRDRAAKGGRGCAKLRRRDPATAQSSKSRRRQAANSADAAAGYQSAIGQHGAPETGAASHDVAEYRALALPRDGAEVSDFNWLKKNLGSNCLIAFQSVSERLPKPALKAMKAEPGRQYCKLTSDGS
jgi:hypothetical protein